LPVHEGIWQDDAAIILGHPLEVLEIIDGDRRSGWHARAWFTTKADDNIDPAFVFFLGRIICAAATLS